jgi:hypothetical protein
MFMQYFRTAWNDYFSSTSLTNLNSQTFSSRQTPSNTGVYVSNCLFDSSASSSQGGALCCTSVTYLLVESTSFFSCKTSSGYGGAIYFSNSGGQSVLYKVCCYDCCTTSSGPYHQFAYIYVNNAVSSKNYINYSSITRCVNVNSNPGYVTSFEYGNVCCQSVNSSMNRIGHVTGIRCNPCSDSNCVTCTISYSSFADNNAAYSHICVYLWRSDANNEIKSCNIIRNTQSMLNSWGTISIIGKATITDTCILENKADYTFYQSSSSTYLITLSNCTIDKATFSGSYKITNTVTKNFIHALNHMSTRNCHSEYDTVGTLTPIAQLPSSSNKQKLYYTCQRLLYQSRLSNFFSLSSIFNLLSV